MTYLSWSLATSPLLLPLPSLTHLPANPHPCLTINPRRQALLLAPRPNHNPLASPGGRVHHRRNEPSKHVTSTPSPRLWYPVSSSSFRSSSSSSWNFHYATGAGSSISSVMAAGAAVASAPVPEMTVASSRELEPAEKVRGFHEGRGRFFPLFPGGFLPLSPLFVRRGAREGGHVPLCF